MTLPKPVTLAAGTTIDLEADATITNPDRWDLDHPAMYRVVATILRNRQSIAREDVLDDEVVPFGIREFHFDPDQGFFLNGKHHKIYGAALHTDAGALGTAVPLAAWERRAWRKLTVNDKQYAAALGAPTVTGEAGYTTLEQLIAADPEELLALHGVGPKAIRILHEEAETR